MLGIFADAALIAFVVWLFKGCSKKSRLQNTVESLGYVLAAIVSVPVAVAVADFSYSAIFRDTIVDQIEPLVTTINNVDSGDNILGRIMTGMPTIVVNAADIYQTTTGDNLVQINRVLAGDLSLASELLVDIIAQPVITGVLRALFFTVLFMALVMGLKAAYPSIEAYFYTPDRMAVSPVVCMVAGLGKVVAVLLICVALLELVGPILPDIYIFRPSSYSWSFVFKLFCKDNLLMFFLGDGVYPQY